MVGKSTLVNRFLKLEEGNRAKVGRSGGATTIDVSEYESSIERGLKVRFFYPPGFIDVNHPDEGIVATILEKTESKLDLFLYCISLSHPTRVQQSDASAFQLLTRSLGSEIWNKAVIVLTFANALEDNKKDADEYLEVVKCIEGNVHKVLRDNGVSEEILSKLPVVTAGHTNPILKYEKNKSPETWEDRLLLAALKQVDPSVFPTLLQFHFNWTDVKATLAGAGGLGIVCGGVGTAIGAGVGVVGGPVGVAIGAVVGGGIGLAVGSTGGAGSGLAISKLMKMKAIIKINYLKWKLKKEKKNSK